MGELCFNTWTPDFLRLSRAADTHQEEQETWHLIFIFYLLQAEKPLLFILQFLPTVGRGETSVLLSGISNLGILVLGLGRWLSLWSTGYKHGDPSLVPYNYVKSQACGSAISMLGRGGVQAIA